MSYVFSTQLSCHKDISFLTRAGSFDCRQTVREQKVREGHTPIDYNTVSLLNKY